MNRRTLVGAFFWSITVGGLLAILNGESQAVSLRLWLAAFATWFAIAVLRRLFTDAPLFPSSVVAVFARRRRVGIQKPDGLRELRALQGLLLRSRDNKRAFTQQLRPRLAGLADHYLLLNHGIDRQADPDRAAHMLGDVRWLIDDRVSDRAPTIEELDSFVHILTSPARSGAEEAP